MKSLIVTLLCAFMLFGYNCCDNGKQIDPESCIDGIQNQDETGVDCGGSCPIVCFDCETDFCAFISGAKFSSSATSKRWKCTFYDGEEMNDDVDCKGALGCEIYQAVRIEFKNKGRADFSSYDGTVSGTWSFDNPTGPKVITIVFDDPEGPYGIREIIPIKDLTENEFHTNEWYGNSAKFEPY